MQPWLCRHHGHRVILTLALQRSVSAIIAGCSQNIALSLDSNSQTPGPGAAQACLQVTVPVADHVEVHAGVAGCARLELVEEVGHHLQRASLIITYQAAEEPSDLQAQSCGLRTNNNSSSA